MGRPRINDEPLTRQELLAKSAADRTARGEHRLSNWISAEAKEALDYLVTLNPGHGAISNALNAALIALAEQAQGKKKAGKPAKGK